MFITMTPHNYRYQKAALAIAPKADLIGMGSLCQWLDMVEVHVHFKQ